MKAEPERYWRALELAEAVLIADKQPNTPLYQNTIPIILVMQLLD